MAYVISHFYEGGTEDQYNAVLGEVHPSEGLPAGQRYHLAGPADGGWLVVAVWDSQESFDTFVNDTLMPALSKGVEGGFAGPPQQRAATVSNEVKA
jgi:heme-degrading monooxygenase HmoA